MNIEDAAKVIYKMTKCDEKDCGNRNCNECEYFTHGIEEYSAKKFFVEYFLKEKYINVGDDEEEKVYSE